MHSFDTLFIGTRSVTDHSAQRQLCCRVRELCALRVTTLVLRDRPACCLRHTRCAHGMALTGALCYAKNALNGQVRVYPQIEGSNPSNTIISLMEPLPSPSILFPQCLHVPFPPLRPCAVQTRAFSLTLSLPLPTLLSPSITSLSESSLKYF